MLSGAAVASTHVSEASLWKQTDATVQSAERRSMVSAPLRDCDDGDDILMEGER